MRGGILKCVEARQRLHLQYVKVVTWPPMSCSAPEPPSAAAQAAAAAEEDEELSTRLEYLQQDEIEKKVTRNAEQTHRARY